jgi:hypothetical protein
MHLTFITYTFLSIMYRPPPPPPFFKVDWWEAPYGGELCEAGVFYFTLDLLQKGWGFHYIVYIWWQSTILGKVESS